MAAGVTYGKENVPTGRTAPTNWVMGQCAQCGGGLHQQDGVPATCEACEPKKKAKS